MKDLKNDILKVINIIVLENLVNIFVSVIEKRMEDIGYVENKVEKVLNLLYKVNQNYIFLENRNKIPEVNVENKDNEVKVFQKEDLDMKN